MIAMHPDQLRRAAAADIIIGCNRQNYGDSLL